MTSKGLGSTFYQWTLILLMFLCSTDAYASLQSELIKHSTQLVFNPKLTVTKSQSTTISQSSTVVAKRGFSIKPINCLTTYPDQACQMNIIVTLPEDLVATPVCLYQNGQRLKCWVPVDRFTFDAEVKINNRDIFELKDLDLINFYRQEVKVSATQNKRRRLRPRWSIF